MRILVCVCVCCVRVRACVCVRFFNPGKEEEGNIFEVSCRPNVVRVRIFIVEVK
jgi:hypothetical protein